MMRCTDRRNHAAGARDRSWPPVPVTGQRHPSTSHPIPASRSASISLTAIAAAPISTRDRATDLTPKVGEILYVVLRNARTFAEDYSI